MKKFTFVLTTILFLRFYPSTAFYFTQYLIDYLKLQTYEYNYLLEEDN